MSTVPEPPQAYRAFVERYPDLGEAWGKIADAGRKGPLDQETPVRRASMRRTPTRSARFSPKRKVQAQGQNEGPWFVRGPWGMRSMDDAGRSAPPQNATKLTNRSTSTILHQCMTPRVAGESCAGDQPGYIGWAVARP